jgi:hypothetical protein
MQGVFEGAMVLHWVTGAERRSVIESYERCRATSDGLAFWLIEKARATDGSPLVSSARENDWGDGYAITMEQAATDDRVGARLAVADACEAYWKRAARWAHRIFKTVDAARAENRSAYTYAWDHPRADLHQYKSDVHREWAAYLKTL